MSDDRVVSSHARRTAQLAGTAAHIAARSGAAKVLRAGVTGETGHPEPKARERAAIRQQEKSAEALARVLGRMRGGAMKVGQLLSTIDLGVMPDDVRPQLQAILASLQQDAQPVSFRAVEQVLAEDLGAPLSRVFSDLDPAPFAAASVGQVHRARLRENGQEVAVKVQYPGVAEAIHSDMRNLRLGLRLLAVIAPSLDTAAIAVEIRERITAELDYESEAANQAEVARIYDGHPYILVPAVFSELCSERVLVTAFVEGERFAEAVTWSQCARDRLGEILARFYVNGPLRHGLLNGDPHPGNTLYLSDGRVAFLDFGFFRRLDDRDVSQVRRSIQAMLAGDADGLLRVAGEVGALPLDARLAQPFLESFAAIIGWMFTDERVAVDADHTAAMMRDYFAMRHSEWFTELHVPAQHLALLRTVVTLIGVLGQLHACNNWRTIAGEWIAPGGPQTDLGRLEDAFLIR